jgi:chemotaxis protein methyltransferase CheR
MFRDPAQFELLEDELLPLLLADGRELTVWSAGCADGSELASLALLLDRLGALERAFLLGSDVLVENLVSATRLSRDDSLPAHVRMRLRWEQRDVVRDGAPEGPWRLVVCRNLAIYLNPEAKTALHATLAAALASDGVLLLGRSERLSSPQALGLERVGAHAYRKVTR